MRFTGWDGRSYVITPRMMERMGYDSERYPPLYPWKTAVWFAHHQTSEVVAGFIGDNPSVLCSSDVARDCSRPPFSLRLKRPFRSPETVAFRKEIARRLWDKRSS